VADGGEAHQQGDILRRHAPARGLAEHADQQDGEHDGEHHHQGRGEAAHQLFAQSGIE
jgi:hypothetical protein